MILGHAARQRMDAAIHDPRRSAACTGRTTTRRRILAGQAGAEPLSDAFDAQYLLGATRKRSVAIKQFIMNSQVVVGVGNIYASEALFRARISPRRAARRITRKEAAVLAQAIKDVLGEAIKIGGRRCATTSMPTARRDISARSYSSTNARCGVPGVRVGHQAIRPGPAFHVLVLDLPALRRRGGVA